MLRDWLPALPDLLFLMGGGNNMQCNVNDSKARINFKEIASPAVQTRIPLDDRPALHLCA